MQRRNLTITLEDMALAVAEKYNLHNQPYGFDVVISGNYGGDGDHVIRFNVGRDGTNIFYAGQVFISYEKHKEQADVN